MRKPFVSPERRALPDVKGDTEDDRRVTESDQDFNPTDDYETKNSQGAEHAKHVFNKHPVNNNTIKDISTNFNPKTVHLYNITEIKGPIRVHFQDDKIGNSKGFTYQRTNFDGTLKENAIVLLKNKADKSTLMHEFAHVYLTTLNNLAIQNDKAKDLLNIINKWLRYNGKEYTDKQHEKFANNFVAYVRSGKAPTYGLKRVGYLPKEATSLFFVICYLYDYKNAFRAY